MNANGWWPVYQQGWVTQGSTTTQMTPVTYTVTTTGSAPQTQRVEVEPERAETPLEWLDRRVEEVCTRAALV